MKTLPQLVIQTLTPDLVSELVSTLHHPLVYRYIDQPLPARAEQVADLQYGLALAAQSEGASSQRWLHFLLREAAQQQIIGRLEATVYLNHSPPFYDKFQVQPANSLQLVFVLHFSLLRRCVFRPQVVISLRSYAREP